MAQFRHAEIIGQAILLGAIQSSIGSVELSSKFSIASFAKDQDTLQRAADALSGYLIIAFIWMLGTCLVLYSEFGWLGLIYNAITNLIIIAWIYFSYWREFRVAAKRHSLELPKMFVKY